MPYTIPVRALANLINYYKKAVRNNSYGLFALIVVDYEQDTQSVNDYYNIFIKSKYKTIDKQSRHKCI
jgi:hypothetical protein